MKAAIAGGHGKIALALTQLLSTRGDAVLGLIRKSEHAEDIRAAGGQPVLCDLEGDDDAAAAIAGCDAVVFAAGAGPGSGAERKWTVDYGGAVKLIEACRRAGVERYVMVSSIGASPDAATTPGIRAVPRPAGGRRHLPGEHLVTTSSRSTCAPRARPTPTWRPAAWRTPSSGPGR